MKINCATIAATTLLALSAALAAAQTAAQPGASGPGTSNRARQGSTATPETSGAAGQTQPGSQSGADAKGAHAQSFMREAAIGGMAEVELGRVASEKSSSDEVKQFAQRMVTDHGKANAELKTLAEKKGISLPTELDSKHKHTVDKLSKLSGEAFDRAYMDEMRKDHKKDVSEFKQQSISGSDPEIKSWAAVTLPTLQEHMQMAERTHAVVGTSGKKNGTTRSTDRAGSGPRSGAGAGTGNGAANPNPTTPGR